MGVELNLIRVSLMNNAKVCKLQKLKSICSWQMEVCVILGTNSMQVYKHSKCSDKGSYFK